MNKIPPKKVAQILTEGNAKQKALLFCKNTDLKTTNQDPILTKDEEDGLLNSVVGEFQQEFYSWVHFYDAIGSTVPAVALTYGDYVGCYNELLALVRQWDAYEQEVGHLDAIYKAVCCCGDEETIHTLETSIKGIRTEYASYSINEDGHVCVSYHPNEKDIDLFVDIMQSKENLVRAYAAFKGAITALEDWTFQHRCKSFIPDALVDYIEAGKKDNALESLPKFSQLALKRRLDAGAEVTDLDREFAVFPSYDSIVADPVYYDLFKKKLDDNYREN